MSRGGIGIPPPPVSGGVTIVDADPVVVSGVTTPSIPSPVPALQAPGPMAPVFQGAILLDVQPVALPPSNFLVLT